MPQLPGDLVVGNQPPGFGVRPSLFNSLDDIQVIEHVIEAAVVGELVEEGPHRFLGVLHGGSIARRPEGAW